VLVAGLSPRAVPRRPAPLPSRRPRAGRAAQPPARGAGRAARGC